MKENFIEIIKRDGSRERFSETAIPGLRFNLLGENNHICIHEGTQFVDCSFSFISNVYVEIGKSKHKIVKLFLFGNGAHIEIGEDFSCWGVEIRCHEPNTMVSIGNDCMFSEDILIYPTDIHTIYDIESGNLLNLGGSVTIGNHVWCGRAVKILKDSVVGNDTVIGMGSIVKSKYLENNVILAGVPATIVREGINWRRESPYQYLQWQQQDR